MPLHIGQILGDQHVALYELIFENEPPNLVDHQVDYGENGQVLYPGVLDLGPEFRFDAQNDRWIVEKKLKSVAISVVITLEFRVAVHQFDRVCGKESLCYKVCNTKFLFCRTKLVREWFI